MSPRRREVRGEEVRLRASGPLRQGGRRRPPNPGPLACQTPPLPRVCLECLREQKDERCCPAWGIRPLRGGGGVTGSGARGEEPG